MSILSVNCALSQCAPVGEVQHNPVVEAQCGLVEEAQHDLVADTQCCPVEGSQIGL